MIDPYLVSILGILFATQLDTTRRVRKIEKKVQV